MAEITTVRTLVVPDTKPHRGQVPTPRSRRYPPKPDQVPTDPSGPSQPGRAGAIADVERVRALLIAAAQRGEPMSYSELLIGLGHRFTRPKMRALCRTLDAIDAAAAVRGEPDLAVLVVREADGLPGQGWWSGKRTLIAGYGGAWTGPHADAFVRKLHKQAFAYWKASSHQNSQASS